VVNYAGYWLKEIVNVLWLEGNETMAWWTKTGLRCEVLG